LNVALDLKALATRLLQAREVLAYSIDDVCAATGLEHSRVDAIESGTQRPSGDEILILASFYDCDFRAFLDQDLPAPVQQTDILFRRYGETFSPEDRRAVQEFLRLCEMEAELESLLNIEKRSFSTKTVGGFYKAHGEQASEALRRQLGYEDNEAPRDVYQDFRAIGIHIFRRKLENSDISGLYVQHPVAGHCVLVNYDEDIYRQRFSVAHEVAHAIFDAEDGVMVTYKPASSKYSPQDLQEIRANSFASCYLMPPMMLRKLGRVDQSTALHWAQQFRVSTAALAKALKDINLIDDNEAAAIKSVRVPREEKIDPEAPENLSPVQRERRLALLERGLSDYYVGLCMEAHYRNLISTGSLVESLRVDFSELAAVAALYGRNVGHGA
jgi:Zn-dependent peptidase ImmA (M78 family)